MYSNVHSLEQYYIIYFSNNINFLNIITIIYIPLVLVER